MTKVSMTYAELGQHLGIRPESAKRLALRKRWARIRGNDGLARVQVELEELPSKMKRDITGDITSDVFGDTSGDQDVNVRSLVKVIEALRSELSGALQRENEADLRLHKALDELSVLKVDAAVATALKDAAEKQLEEREKTLRVLLNNNDNRTSFWSRFWPK